MGLYLIVFVFLVFKLKFNLKLFFLIRAFKSGDQNEAMELGGMVL